MLKGSILVPLFSLSLLAQTSAIVGASYVPPAPVSAAPGQILTVFVTGLNASSTTHAPAGALPTSLAGVTATLYQGSDIPAPVVDVRPISTCPDLTASSVTCSTLTAVTVQIPYELVPFCPLCALALPAAQLFVSQNGFTSTSIELNALADQTHILTACDIVVAPAAIPATLMITTGLSCASIVTHMDGSIVSASSPANPGETITAWAVGLGQTNPPATTGQPASSAAPTAQTFYLNYDYELNALAVKPYTSDPDRKPPTPLYSGLAPGYPGLYQINFVVPPAPANGIARCAVPGTVGPGANSVTSNLTVSFGGGYSFDAARICVATQIPVD